MACLNFLILGRSSVVQSVIVAKSNPSVNLFLTTVAQSTALFSASSLLIRLGAFVRGCVTIVPTLLRLVGCDVTTSC